MVCLDFFFFINIIYAGLPPSPPMALGNIDNGGYGNDNNPKTIHPLAADVRKQKEKQNGTVIAIIILSAVIALALCVGAAWVFLLKHRELSHLPIITPQMSLPPFSKASGTSISYSICLMVIFSEFVRLDHDKLTIISSNLNNIVLVVIMLHLLIEVILYGQSLAT